MKKMIKLDLKFYLFSKLILMSACVSLLLGSIASPRSVLANSAFGASPTIAKAITKTITPYLGASKDWECGSLNLDQQNVIGFTTVRMDLQTVNAHVIYRAGSVGHRSLRLRLMKQDADALNSEIEALIKKIRPKPIRFLSHTAKDGQCEVFEISAG